MQCPCIISISGHKEKSWIQTRPCGKDLTHRQVILGSNCGVHATSRSSLVRMPYRILTVALKVLRPRITMSDNGTKLS